MPILHPDKLIGIARAIQTRPKRARPSVESAAVAASAKPRRLSPPKGKDQKDPADLMRNLAFQIRDAHWNGHLERMARRADGAVKPKKAPAKRPAQPASGQPQSITIQLGQGPPKAS
jgi:hypothetical protein